MASATRSKKRQTRLSFQPATSSSPPQDQEPPVTDRSSVTRETRSSSRRVAQTPLTFESSRVTRSHGLPTPLASSQGPPAAIEEPELTSDDSDNSQPSIMRFRSRQGPRRRATDMFTPVTPRKSQGPVEEALPSSDRQKQSRPNPLFTPSKRTTTSSFNKAESDSDVQVTSIHRKPRPTIDISDDDRPSGTSQRRNGNEREDESDDEPVTPRKRLRRAPRVEDIFSDSEEPPQDISSDAESLATVPPVSVKDRERDNEVQEDAQDLEDTEVRSNRTRGTKSTVKSARQKSLEKLKAQRAGKSVAATASDSSSEAVEQSAVDHMWQRSSRLRQETEEADDNDDFIIEDEDEDWRTEMPLKFSAQAHMEAKNYFKHVVEWMVHKKLNPAFNRDDELYVMSFQKIDDEAKGFAGSKFSSSIWRPLFLRALKARPEFNDVEDDSVILPMGCEACGHTTHPARWRVSFSGKAYHPHTLEPLKEEDEQEDDDDDEEDAADDQSYDIDGNRVPAERHEFKVGRHCKSNAFIAHSLLHWRWHLNEWVVGWLESEQYLTPQRLVERDSWSIKKRGDFANKVVDTMEESGEIRALRRDFKNRLEQARSMKAAAFGRVDEFRG